jgi:hypothetical protein
VGLKSSGSTWLYNVAISVLKEAFKGAKIGAFYADNFGMFPPGASQARILVLKTHEPSDAVLFLNRFTRGQMLISVREPRDSVASLMQRFSHSFESALRDVTVEGERLVALARSSRKALTLRYEDGFPDDEKTVDRVARYLGVTVSAAARRRIFRSHTKEAVKKTIRKLHGRRRDPDAFDLTTQWHPGHVGDGRVGKYKTVLTAAQQRKIEAATKAYAKEFGYLPRKK